MAKTGQAGKNRHPKAPQNIYKGTHADKMTAKDRIRTERMSRARMRKVMAEPLERP